MELESSQIRLQFEFAALTDLGQIRRNNEDAFAFAPEVNFAVVCDGMGGANAGEVASSLAVEFLIHHFRSGAWKRLGGATRSFDPDFSSQTNALGTALTLTNEQVLIQSSSDAGRHGMGTTCVAAWINETLLSIAWAGDSRVYLLRNHLLRALTRDHSVVMEQVRRGLLTAAEARISPIRNVLSRALGTSDELQVDLAELLLQPGDLILLCSDGLCGILSDDQLQSILDRTASEALTLDEICKTLIREVNLLGGPDNITALAIRAAAT
jgi:protein phosphatase